MGEYKPCWSLSYTKARYKDAQKALDNGAILTKRDIVEHWMGNITIQIMEHDIRTLKLLLALLHNLNTEEVLEMDVDDLVEYFYYSGELEFEKDNWDEIADKLFEEKRELWEKLAKV